MPKNQVNPQFHFALSQVFSPSLLKRINDPAHEENIKILLQDCALIPHGEKWDFVKALDITYNYLKENYRCEYVYMNEIANQILLKYHGDNSAALLKELASDRSIADVVIANAKTVAYEIKTELDSFDRLPVQLESYKALYDNVFVVTYPGAIDTLSQKLGNGIGIIVLNEKGELQTVQESENYADNFEPSKAILTLRQTELVAAYEIRNGKMPQMGTALIYHFCHEWYLNLKKHTAKDVFSIALKSRKPAQRQFDLINHCTPALKVLFLGRELSKKYCTLAIDRLGIFV